MAKARNYLSLKELREFVKRIEVPTANRVSPAVVRALDEAFRGTAEAARKRYEEELRKNGYCAPIYFEDPRDPNNLLRYD